MNHKTLIEKYVPQGALVEEQDNLLMFEVKPASILEICKSLYHEHALSLKTITAFDEREGAGCFKIIYVFGIPEENVFIAPYVKVQDSFPSITPIIHEASLYERKIKTFFGLEPQGHPDPRSLILHDENWPKDVHPLRKDFDYKEKPKASHSEFRFNKVEGEGIYEIPVGPVHAGIIEPGHFRFSVAGEEILLLEPRLGYSHKGSEKLFEVLPLEKKIQLSERISGDSSFAYSLLFCQTLEKLADIKISKRAAYLRVIYAELERLANHFGDIGAIMTDTGFNLGAACGAKLRETMLQMNEKATGSRFLRGVSTIGGVKIDISEEVKKEFLAELPKILHDFKQIHEIAENSSSLLNRLKETGVLDMETAKAHGVTGVPARALGIKKDARKEYPYATYDAFEIEPQTAEGGDVYARFTVRIKEIYASLEILKKALEEMPAGAISAEVLNSAFKKSSYAVSVVEGWRGDVICVVSTDVKGEISRVDFRDPSFLNWPALGYAGKGNMVPDFPLINKSFNLSYSGNDL